MGSDTVGACRNTGESHGKKMEHQMDKGSMQAFKRTFACTPVLDSLCLLKLCYRVAEADLNMIFIFI